MLPSDVEYWQSQVEHANNEVRNLQKALDAALERMRQLQSSYQASKCPKCGSIVTGVIP